MIPTQAVELAKRIGNRWKNTTLILYGSFPNDKYDDRSDVDMLVIGRVPETEIRKIAQDVLKHLEQRGEKTWEFSLTFAKNLDELDPSLKAAVGVEGVVLLGRPLISARGLDPHVLVQYEVSGLSATERKRFYKALSSTNLKRYRWKTTLLIPAELANEAEKLLNRYKIMRRKIKVFVKQ